ncbi:MAG: DUF4982 domain-containing protein [Butyrivibrio sp.]|nr:DUF4982 domain-containing protein [Butyrivibrio sp.]
MIREKWNDGWIMTKSGESPMMAAMMGMQGNVDVLTLPHDAMIHEERTQGTKNQHQTGFYPGGCYTYTKKFSAPEEWQEKTVFLEFEGIYEKGRVYINGDYAGGCAYGYSECTVCADDFLHYGAENVVSVIANNSSEENSRWYSGSGIYRNVNILVGQSVHIGQNSLVLEYSDAEEVELFLNGKSLGRRAAGEAQGYMASFETVYEPGTLKAVNYRNGAAAEVTELATAEEGLQMCIETDRTELKADGADLSYIMVSFVDSAGTKNLQAVNNVTVTVEGAGSLQGMGSADPATDNRYDNNCWDTYDGYVLAVVRAGRETGTVTVTVECGGYESRTVQIYCR